MYFSERLVTAYDQALGKSVRVSVSIRPFSRHQPVQCVPSTIKPTAATSTICAACAFNRSPARRCAWCSRGAGSWPCWWPRGSVRGPGRPDLRGHAVPGGRAHPPRRRPALRRVPGLADGVHAVPERVRRGRPHRQRPAHGRDPRLPVAAPHPPRLRHRQARRAARAEPGARSARAFSTCRRWRWLALLEVGAGWIGPAVSRPWPSRW